MKDKSLRVLMIDDSEDDVLLTIRELKKSGYHPVYERVQTAAALKKALKEKQWDIILCDYQMSKFNAPSAIALIKKTNIDTPVIIVAGAISEETAVECMLSGAHDCIMKSNLSHLRPAIARELKEAQIKEKQKQTEETLKETELKFRTIFDSASDGILLARSNDKKFSIANKTICNMLGYTREELLKLDLSDIHPPKSVSYVTEQFKKLSRGEISIAHDISVMKKDRTVFLADISASAITLNGKEYLIGIFRDITERRRAENEIKSAKALLDMVIDMSPFAMWISDREGTVVRVNHSLCKALNLTEDAIIGKYNVLEDANLKNEGVMPLVRTVFEKQEPVRFSIPWKAADSGISDFRGGHDVYIDVSMFPILNDQGELNNVVCQWVDITDLKHAEEELKTSEEKYRTFFKTSRDCVYITSLDGSWIDMNDSAVELFGYSSKDELMRVKIPDLYIRPEERTKHIAVILERGYSKDFPVDLRRKNGTILHTLITATVRCDKQGNPLGFMGTIKDVTERRKAEAALRESENRFREQYNGNPIPTFTWQRKENEFILTGFNDRAKKFMNRQSEALIGKPASEVYKSRQDVLRNMQRCFDKKIILRMETISEHFMPGKIVVVTFAFVPPDLVMVHLEDITKRRQAEEEIRKLASVVQFSSELVNIITPDGKMIFLNEAGAKMLGIDPDRVGEYTIMDVMPRQFHQTVRQEIMPKLLAGNHWEGDLQYRNLKTGELTHVHAITFPIKDTVTGAPVLLANVSRDITERLLSEKSLRESEKKYRLLTDKMNDIVWTMDMDLRTTYASPSVKSVLGFTQEERIGQTVREQLTPASLSLVSETLSGELDLEKTGNADPNRSITISLEYYHKDGSIRWMESNITGLRDDQGNLTGLHGVSRDITERRRADFKLQQTLESLNRAFATTIQVLISALEARDPYTAGHQSRVADLACAIAGDMGLSPDRIEGIRMAGSIHDIGKLSIPAEILSKPTRLTDIEFELIKVHAQSGYDMLKDVESPWPLAEIVYQHHERMNGSGYPRNLKGDEILMEARIMAVADVAEAMASHRPYRPGLGTEAALQEIEKNKGILYDDAVVEACVRLIREKGYQLI